MIVYLGIIAVQIACIVHLMRTGRNPLWLTALIFLPMVSAIAYLIVEILPGAGANRHVRHARAKVEATLDPEREIRAARSALELADTVANRLRLADALTASGRDKEAVPLYREAIEREANHPDPRTQRKLARALFETGEAAESLALIASLDPPPGQSERDRMELLRARVLEHLGRREEALGLYADVVTRMPGEEARCRYAALLLELGWERKAIEVLEEVEARAKRLSRGQRLADADMYRWAAETLRGLRAKG